MKEERKEKKNFLSVSNIDFRYGSQHELLKIELNLIDSIQINPNNCEMIWHVKFILNYKNESYLRSLNMINVHSHILN